MKRSDATFRKMLKPILIALLLAVSCPSSASAMPDFLKVEGDELYRQNVSLTVALYAYCIAMNPMITQQDVDRVKAAGNRFVYKYLPANHKKELLISFYKLTMWVDEEALLQLCVRNIDDQYGPLTPLKMVSFIKKGLTP